MTLSAPSGRMITVQIDTADNTASAGGLLGQNDYEARSGFFALPPGFMTGGFNVTLNGDHILEPNEAFTANLSMATNATIADGTGVATITNDDAPPTLTLIGTQAPEGATGVQNAIVFKVVLSEVSLTPITVVFNTASGTATTGIDFIGQSNVTLTVMAGTLGINRSVFTVGDPTAEVNEAFTATLSSAVGATIATATATGTILNDD